jgi:hypothetical protein
MDSITFKSVYALLKFQIKQSANQKCIPVIITPGINKKRLTMEALNI